MTYKHHTRLELVEGGNIFKQGDHPTLKFIAYDSLGNEVDLTNKQIEGALYSRNKGIMYEAPASFTDGGIVFTIDKLLDNGKFQLEFTATDSANPDYRAKFPSDEYAAQLTIKPSKDNMDFVGVSMTTVAQLKGELQGLQNEFAGQVLPRVDIVEDKQTQLEADYQAAAGALTEDSEVILARKGEPTLRAFNDKVVAQLAEKVGQGVKAEPEDLSDRSMALLTGDGTVNVLSIPQDSSVTPQKTTFLKTGNNKYNPSESKVGRLSSGGGETTEANYIITNYVPVKTGDSVYLYYDAVQTVFNNRIVLYDIEFNILEVISSYVSGTPLTNANVKYFRTSVGDSIAQNQFGINLNELKPHENYYVSFDRVKINRDDIEGFEALEDGSVSAEKLSPEIKRVISFPQDEFKNITKNGDFRNGLTDWSLNRDGAIPSVTDNIATVEMVSTSIKANWQPLQVSTELITGNKYYFSVGLNPDKANTVVLSLKTKSTGLINLVANTWNYVSGLINVDVDPGALDRIAMIFNTLNYTVGEKIRFRNVNVVNLTEKYGAGNEPTKEFLDYIISKHGYIDGTQKVTLAESEKQIVGSVDGVLKPYRATQITSHLYGDEMVCFGDSITGNEFVNDYPSIIAKRTGMKVHNVGFGGTRIGYHEQADYDKFSFYRLVDTVISGDYSSLKQPFVNGRPTPYDPRVAILESIDWSKVKYVSIAYMANDWGANSPNEGATNEDVNSVKGAGRLALRKLLTAYPHLKVIIVSPFYRYFPDANPITDSDDTPRGVQNWYMSEYVEAAKELAKEFHVPFVDVYNGLGINKYTRGQYFNGLDGTHHDARGRIHIGNKIASSILSEY